MARCICGCEMTIKEGRQFAHGHNRRGIRLSPETREKITGRPVTSTDPQTIHQCLAAKHPKAGICEECGRVGKTDYAFLHHPSPHTRRRDDYRELCRSCHFRFDEITIQRGPKLQAIQTREQRQAAGRKGAEARWGQRGLIVNG